MRNLRSLSWLLILAGAAFLSVGARDYTESIIGQREDFGAGMARLSIPRLNASWLVYEGTGDRELRLGPAHMTGTALPGTDGNCVIAGHRDTHFRALKDVQKGDEIQVDTSAGRFTYRVTGLSIVKSSDTSALAPSTHAVLNLITCYPFYYIGPAPDRFVVRAEIVKPTG